MNGRRSWMIQSAASLALVGLWLAFGTTGAVVAKGKPDKGGGGKTEIRLARILFIESTGIRPDAALPCLDPEFGEWWDYWDHRDPVLTEDPDCPEPSRIDVSGGGRVKFFTTGRRHRWLTLDFRAHGECVHPDPSPVGPNIDLNVYSDPTVLYGPDIDPDPFVDNVKVTITLSSMFKNNATRQPLDLTIRARDSATGGWRGSGWTLHSVDDLYVVNDPEGDEDVRILTTWNQQTGNHDADFELWHDGVKWGTYCFPLTWELRIIPAP